MVFRQVSETNKKLEIIEEQLPHILEQYKKYFIFYNKNPEVAEYQQFYVQYKTQIEQLNSQLGRMSTDIQSNIQKVNKSVNKANFQIKDKKKEFAELIKNFEHYQDSLQGAEQMIDDYKTLYNKQYYKNVQLVVGILFIFLLTGKLMSQK